MPLTRLTAEKFKRTAELVRKVGGAYTAAPEYQVKAGDFLPPEEWSADRQALSDRAPRDTVWFDLEVLRGGWGVPAQVKAGRSELRLAVPFTRLGWAEVGRRYLSATEVRTLLVPALVWLVPASRYTEAEQEAWRSALLKAPGCWCLDQGETWASAYEVLAHERAWERGFAAAKKRASDLWANLSVSERSEAMTFIRKIWNRPELTESECSLEFYAALFSRATRWVGGPLATVPLPAVLKQALSQVQPEAAGLTRPMEVPSVAALAALWLKQKSEFIKAINLADQQLEFLGSGPRLVATAIALTDWQPEQTNAVVKQLGYTLDEFMVRAGRGAEAVAATLTEIAQLLRTAPSKQNSPVGVVPSELAGVMVDSLVDPKLSADIIEGASSWPTAYSIQVARLLRKLVLSLGDLQYLWYSLWEAIRESTDWLVVAARSTRAPWWDATPTVVLDLIKTKAVDWAEMNFNLVDGMSNYATSFSEFFRQDGIALSTTPVSDFLGRLAQTMADCKLEVDATNKLTVQRLIAAYRTVVTSSKAGPLERLSLIQQLKVSPARQNICRTILEWYDGLLEAQAEFDQAQEFWNQVAATRPATEEASPSSNTPVAPPVVFSAPAQPPAKPVPASTVSIPKAPSVMKSAGPVLMFDTADEQEVDKFRAQLAQGNWQTAGSLERQLRALAEEVISAHKFSFKDEVSKTRFVQLFVSRLKDVRSIIDVREVLTKPVTSGGLGLPSDKVEQVINIIEQAKQEFAARQAAGTLPTALPTEPALLSAPAPSAPSGVVMPKGDKVGPEIQMPADISWSPEQAAGTKPTSSQISDWREEMLEELARISPESPTPTSASTPPRPQLTDVKAPPRTLGPLEELKTLSLTDFRRLDSSPLDALARVRAKLDLIGEASVARRLEAVRAWQASPLYQLYLSLGRESIETGKTVAQLIAERQSAAQVTLSEAEFEAIVDFNSKIRF